MYCNAFPLGERRNYKYVVTFSVYQGRLLFSRHRDRETWETQGGHIEPGETPLEAARRELFEESGAVDFQIRPAFDYRAGDDRDGADGVVFIANVKELGPLPPSEMAEVRLFDRLPEALTYPGITPVLYQHAQSLFSLQAEGTEKAGS